MERVSSRFLCTFLRKENKSLFEDLSESQRVELAKSLMAILLRKSASAAANLAGIKVIRPPVARTTKFAPPQRDDQGSSLKAGPLRVQRHPTSARQPPGPSTSQFYDAAAYGVPAVTRRGKTYYWVNSYNEPRWQLRCNEEDPRYLHWTHTPIDETLLQMVTTRAYNAGFRSTRGNKRESLDKVSIAFISTLQLHEEEEMTDLDVTDVVFSLMELILSQSPEIAEVTAHLRFDPDTQSHE